MKTRGRLFPIFAQALLIVAVASSCSTICNLPKVNILVDSDDDSAMFCVNYDTTHWMHVPANIFVKRTSDVLWLVAKSDSLQRNIFVKSGLSGTYFFGNACSPCCSGCLIDLTNNNMYTYPSSIIITHDDQYWSYVRGRRYASGLFKANISIPEANFFYINTGEKHQTLSGYLGITAGFEYYYRDNSSLDFDFGTTFNAPKPVPASVRHHDDYEQANAMFASLKTGTNMGNLHVNAGVQFNHCEYRFHKKDIVRGGFPDSLSSRVNMNNFGLALSAYHPIYKALSVGVNYYPSFVSRPSGDVALEYSHMLFFNVRLTAEISNPRKREVTTYNIE